VFKKSETKNKTTRPYCYCTLLKFIQLFGYPAASLQ